MPKRARNDSQTSTSGSNPKHARVGVDFARQQPSSGIVRQLAATAGKKNSPLHVSDSEHESSLPGSPSMERVPDQEDTGIRNLSASPAQDAQCEHDAHQDLLSGAGLSPYTASSAHVRSMGREASDDPTASHETSEDHDGLDKIGKRIQRELQKAQLRREALQDEIERSKAKRQVLEKDAEKMRELLEYFQKIRQRT